MEKFGDITLYNANCMDIMAKLPDNSIDAIITDPPYGIGFLSSWTDNHKYINNDKPGEFNIEMPKWLKQFKRLLTDNGVACCCIGGGGRIPVSAIFTMEVIKQGFNLIQTVIWDKQTIGFGWRYRPSYETILVFSKNKKFNWYANTKDISNIVRIGNIIPQKYEHPTPKPVQLMGHFIKLHTLEGMVVLDPFLGGGTTALACNALKRKCIGIELEKDYYKLAKNRIISEISQLTIF